MENQDYVFYALCAFYSRIVLRKLTSIQLEIFRKLERSCKIVVKCNADIKFTASEAKRSRRRRLRGAEQAHSHVMGSENSALAPKILIFRKNGTDEKGLIFGCRIHI